MRWRRLLDLRVGSPFVESSQLLRELRNLLAEDCVFKRQLAKLLLIQRVRNMQ